MKKILVLLVPVLLVSIYLVSLFIPKTKVFSKDSSDLGALDISMSFAATNYQVLSHESAIIDGELLYTGSSPSVDIEEGKLVIQGQKSKTSKIILPNNKETKLLLAAGAGDFTLLLKDTLVNDMEVNAGAGNIYVELPEKKSSQVNVVIGAGNLNIGVPSGVDGIRIIPATGTVLNLASGSYRQVDGGYESIDYAQAKVKADLTLSVGTAKLSIKEL